MKRLLMIVVAVWLSFAGSVRGQGPDDRYIEIYKLIQEGDQSLATAQPAAARDRYNSAMDELKKLQTAYPNWNKQLVEYRLRTIENKLSEIAKSAPATTTTPAVKPANPSPAPQVQPTAPPPRRVLPEADERDQQIRMLQEQISRLQSDRTVLEAKLREALSAQPAAVDPRELSRAEERIKSLEKDKEVLRVSVELAEARAARQSSNDSASLKKALDEATLNLARQTEVLTALRLEKDTLQQRLQTSTRNDEELLRTLRAENQSLKQQLAQRPAGNAQEKEQLEKELASTKAALQTSRDSANSLQSRVRALQDERDRLDVARRELETKLAANATASRSATDASVKMIALEKERDQLREKLTEATQQLASARATTATAPVSAAAAEELNGLRARLEALEARKVPYTAEELALFKAPQVATVVAATPAPAPQSPPKELPANASMLLAEAHRAFSARRFEEAEKKYAEVLQFDDKNIATLQRLASAQLEQNRPKDAEISLKKALDQNPKDPRSLLLMGIAKFDQDKFDEAFDNLSRAALADPQNPETQNYLGITLSHKGQRAGAETALRKAIQLSPNYSSAHYNLAVVYANQQPPFTELARWHYQKALAYGHPANSEVEKMLERKQTTSQK